jgi:antirestriction protein ArdC
VFNASCVKGLEPYIKPNQEVKPFEVVEMFSEALKERTGLKVEHSARGKAYYSPSEHKIHMPNHEFFKSSEAYADTFFHESGHSTGKAMGRDMSGKFGAEGEAGKKYAHEELIAELSSSFLSVELNIPHNPSSHENQAAYIKSWLQVLENDKTFIFKASNQASKAVEYMVGHYNSYKQELEQKQSMKDSEVEVINFADKLASSFAKQKTVQSKSSALSM